MKTKRETPTRTKRVVMHSWVITAKYISVTMIAKELRRARKGHLKKTKIIEVMEVGTASNGGEYN
jgi:hypothetical protein